MATKLAIVAWRGSFEKFAPTLARDYPDVYIEEFYGQNSWNKTLDGAKKAVGSGFEIIITRWYILERIKQQVSVPVVAVEPDMVDLVECAIEYKRRGLKGSAVVILNENNMLLQHEHLGEYLNDLFGTTVQIERYKTATDYDATVCQFLDQNVTLITGQTGIDLCRPHQKEVILLSVGTNAIKNAIAEAIKICDIRRNDRIHKAQLDTVINAVDEGVIYLDAAGGVKLMNDKAKQVLKLERDVDYRQVHLGDCFPASGFGRFWEENTRDAIAVTDKGVDVLMNTFHVKQGGKAIGAVLSFRETRKIIESEKRIRADLYRKGQVAKYNFSDIIGESPAIQKRKSIALKFAQTDNNVMIYGETGSGKELFAQSIHNNSSRKNEPFYAVNCATLSESLLESELFGYSEGSFTGAKKGGKAGLFELAHKGAVYLDEIGELSLASQSSLLRVLQEKEVRRIGDDRIIPVDVRVIVASHKNITDEIRAGRFREDLFYRINTLFLDIPPLRERQDDIHMLLQHFQRTYCNGYAHAGIFTFDEGASRYLTQYDWPGNVRELQNFVQRMHSMMDVRAVVTAKDVEGLLINHSEKPPAEPDVRPGQPTHRKIFENYVRL